MGTGTADAVVGAKACEIGVSAENAVRLMDARPTNCLSVQIEPTLPAVWDKVNLLEQCFTFEKSPCKVSTVDIRYLPQPRR
jgi:hypothetical protein